jgi:hypothetical protein
VIDGFFQKFLHRPVDQVGLTFFLNVLSGGGTDEQVEALILGSTDYFQNRAGSSNSAFLSAMYQDCVGHAPDASAVSNFTQALANGATRAQVSAVVLASTEFQHNLIQSDFNQLLHRKADDKGLAFWTNLLSTGGKDEDVVNGVFTSPEFQSQL